MSNYRKQTDEVIETIAIDEKAKQFMKSDENSYSIIEQNIFNTLSLLEIEASRMNEFCETLNESLEDAKPYIDELKHLEIESNEDYTKALKPLSEIDKKLDYDYLIHKFNSLNFEMLDAKALFHVLEIVDTEDEDRT